MAAGSMEDIISRAWGAYKKNYFSFIAALLLWGIITGIIFVIGLLPLISIVGGLMASGLSSSQVVAALFGRLSELTFSISFAVIFFACSVLLSYVLEGGFVAMTVEALTKGKTSFRTMFSAARSKWKGFLGVGLVVTIITTVVLVLLILPALLTLMAGSTVSGMALLILGFLAMIPVALLLEVVFAFVYLAVLDGKRTMAAIGASVAFGRSHFWKTLALIVFFTVLSFLAGLLNAATYILGSLVAYFVVVPLQLLSIAALYLGRKKGGAMRVKKK